MEKLRALIVFALVAAWWASPPHLNAWDIFGVENPSAINGVSSPSGVNGIAVFPPDDVIIYPESRDSVIDAWSAHEGTDKWDQVDEPFLYPDDDVTYIYRNTTEGSQAWNNLPTGLPNGAILGVSVTFRAKHLGAPVQLASLMRVGETTTSNGYIMTPPNYEDYGYEWTTNPVTGMPWTKADVEGTGANPIQAWGIELSLLGSSNVRVTTMHLEVRYNP